MNHIEQKGLESQQAKVGNIWSQFVQGPLSLKWFNFNPSMDK